MRKEQIIQTIVDLSRKKYRVLIEILRQTEELELVLQSNDKESISMVMRMRAREMEVVNGIDREISYCMSQLDNQTRKVLKEDIKSNEVSASIKEYQEVKALSKRTLEKTILIDKRISLKLAGTHSFYAQSK